jgi:hypothetical protein
MTRAEWERARQLGEEARRAGRDRDGANPWAEAYHGDGVGLALAFDEGWIRADEERRR